MVSDSPPRVDPWINGRGEKMKNKTSQKIAMQSDCNLYIVESNEKY